MANAYVDSRAVAYLLQTRVRQRVMDYVVNSSPLMREINKAGCIKYNQKWNVGYEFYAQWRNSFVGQVFGVGDFQNVQGSVPDDNVKITVPGSNLMASIALSKLFNQRTQGMSGPDANYDLLMTQINTIKQALAITFIKDLYADGTQRATDTKAPMIGLKGAIANTGTYLGIDRTAAANSVAGGPWWRAQVNTAVANFNAETTLSGEKDGLIQMRDLHTKITLIGKQSGGDIPKDLTQGNEDYDAVFTGALGYEYYMNAFQGRRRYTSDQSDANADVTFYRKPVFPDAYFTPAVAPADAMYFIPYKYLHIMSAEKSGSLFDLQAEGKINLVDTQIFGGQYVTYIDKPLAFGKLPITNQ